MKRPAPPAARERGFSVRRLLRDLGGAELCYGDPVTAGGRTVIPVARVRAAGGGGFGESAPAADEPGSGGGGGGGGWFDASPVGYIEVAGDGARFVEIADPDRAARLVRAAAGAATTLLGAVAGARALRGTGRGAPRRLGRGR
jgi:uncharacterized spore protein YtfJ